MDVIIISGNGKYRWSKLLFDILQINGYQVQIKTDIEMPLDSKTLYICDYDFVKRNHYILKSVQDRKNLLFVVENYEKLPTDILVKGLEISYPLNTHVILRQIESIIDILKRKEQISVEYIGNSRFALELREKIDIVSATDAMILITGESGTGKDVVSQIIHAKSKRSDEKFVKINCASIPNTLMESELFGYKKGAFTGAEVDYVGKLVYTSGGTLFFDEIGELTIDLQAKLLRVLEERVVIPLGSNEQIPIDVRYIFATNKNMVEEVRNKRFREDLYYRINTIKLHLIPLREHKEDIPYLVDHFVKVYNRKYNKNFQGLEINDMLKLYNYNWPGNIREVQNFVERLVIYSDGKVYPDITKLLDGVDIDGSLPKNTPSLYKESMMNYERYLITSYLIKNHWNIVKTAKEMGIERTNLYKKMKKLEIESNKFET